MADWTADYGTPQSQSPFEQPMPPMGGIGQPYETPGVTSASPFQPAAQSQEVRAQTGYGSYGYASQSTGADGQTTGGRIGWNEGQAGGSTDVPGVGTASWKATGGAEVDAGSYLDADGKQNYGVQAQGSVATVSGQVNGPNGQSVGGTVQGPNGYFGVNANDSDFQIGAEGNLASVSVNAGTQNKDSAVDESASIGLSAGVGAAARLHYGDADGDGHPEYGFGADIGPVSFDYKTEDPVRTAAKAVGGPLAGPAMDALGIGVGADGKQTNMTDDAAAAAKDLWSYVAD